MAWKVPRRRYGAADALTEEEIQTLQASPETAPDHVGGCNACRRAVWGQRPTLETTAEVFGTLGECAR